MTAVRAYYLGSGEIAVPALEALRRRPNEASEAAVTSEAAASMEEDTIGMLPCGHCFHSDCIGHWLQREARCPLCRQAAHGIDRVLEIMF